jgi:uncharacterized damage-inducible protein DinB
VLATDTAVMLATYGDWADQVLFDAVAVLPEDVVHGPRPTLFGSMIGTLNHNLQVDLIWRAHLLQQPHGFTSRRDLLHPRLPDLVAAQREANAWYIAWARAQDPGSLAQRLRFTFVSGEAAEMPRGGMFLHVVNHRTYHRGWIAEMMLASGVAPPETDLSVFLSRQVRGYSTTRSH